MNKFIPIGTTYFTSNYGAYNFIYPSKTWDHTECDINIVEEMSWLKQNGLSAYNTLIGIIWCDKSSVMIHS